MCKTDNKTRKYIASLPRDKSPTKAEKTEQGKLDNKGVWLPAGLQSRRKKIDYVAKDAAKTTQLQYFMSTDV